MGATIQKSDTAVTTGQYAVTGCTIPQPGVGASYARIHTWWVRNRNGSTATVRPQGTLVEEYNSLASSPSVWVDLGASATNIAAGAAALITVIDQPLARTQLNVTTLAGDGLDIIYAGYVP